MTVDLFHNKIISDTLSEKFKESFTNNLIPKLNERFGDKLYAVQMYEDFLCDNFIKDGRFYYPLSLSTEEGNKRFWIMWDVSDKNKFVKSVPYDYIGEEEIDFVLSPDVPCEFEERIAMRKIFFCDEGIKLEISAASRDKLFLVGKYSQSFVDELSRQISNALEEKFSLKGVVSSTLKLVVEFAPHTFMEHVSENVTYRRFLITAKGCFKKDFWVRWKNLKSDLPLTISDTVSSSDILFEICDSVPQRIREKEYRYLVRVSSDQYQDAMGRKNITEWRDLIKRIIRRGEVEQIEISPLDKDLNGGESILAFKLQEILGVKMEDSDDSSADDLAQSEENDDELSMKLRNVLKDNTVGVSEKSLGSESNDEPKNVQTDDENYDAGASEDDDAAEDENAEFRDAYPDGEDAEDIEQLNKLEGIDDHESALHDAEEEAVTARVQSAEQDTAKQNAVPTRPSGEDKAEINAEREAELRKTIEAQLRLELAKEAELQAKSEADALRREKEELMQLNIRLEERARAAEEERQKIEREKEEKTEALRREIEAKERAEIRERERIAEAARLAVIEQERIRKEEAEKAEKLKEEIEAAKLREEKLREEKRREERLREEEIAKRKIEEEKFANLPFTNNQYFQLNQDNKKVSQVEEREKPKIKYTYTQKTVRLLFRVPVDPGVLKRIHEIIIKTIKYFNKEDVYIKIKATVPDTNTVNLHFVEVPKEEEELIVNIIKVLGKSELNISKAYLE